MTGRNRRLWVPPYTSLEGSEIWGLALLVLVIVTAITRPMLLLCFTELDFILPNALSENYYVPRRLRYGELEKLADCELRQVLKPGLKRGFHLQPVSKHSVTRSCRQPVPGWVCMSWKKQCWTWNVETLFALSALALTSQRSLLRGQ